MFCRLTEPTSVIPLAGLVSNPVPAVTDTTLASALSLPAAVIESPEPTKIPPKSEEVAGANS